MNCANGGNNKFLNFPAFMADGRNFAEWMPQAVVNNNIRKREGILTNWQYRKFLQSNSSDIIEANQLLACDECSTCPYYKDYEKQQRQNPYLYKSYVQYSKPIGYEESDLKSLYVSKEDLNSRMVVPIASQDLLLSLKRAN